MYGMRVYLEFVGKQLASRLLVSEFTVEVKPV